MSKFGKIAGYKSQIFANLRGKDNKILELGIGTGPNLKYYAGNNDVDVVGVDPNQKMEKYAQAAAVSNGIPPEKFKFIQAVRLFHILLHLLILILFSYGIFFLKVVKSKNDFPVQTRFQATDVSANNSQSLCAAHLFRKKTMDLC